MAQDPYLKSEELGQTIDEVENLIKKHEAFEKAAAAQEERFAALERLTTFELKELRRRQDEELERQRQEEIARHSADRPDGADRRSETGSIRSGRQPQEPLVRKSSQPKKSPVVAEAPPVEPEPAGAAAAVPPPVIEQSPPVTSPEVGTDSEAGGKERDGDELEGMLVRKNEWENTTKKASNRSWEKMCVVIKGTKMLFYKDQKSYRSSPDNMYRGESPMELQGGTAEVASDYTKKRHVFRLKLSNGGESLFQASDDDEMSQWVESINAVANPGSGSGAGRAQTLPAGERRPGDEPKKRSFFTLKKK